MKVERSADEQPERNVAQLDVLILVLELPLPIFLVLPPNDGLLLEILGFEVLPQLIDLPIECVYDLILALEDVLELDLLGLSLVYLVRSFLHFQLHLLVLIDQRLRLEVDAIDLGLKVTVLVLELLDLFLVLEE